MDLGNPPPASRSHTLLAELRDGVVAQRDLRVAELRHIAEWAALHVVDEESGDAATITERGLDTGLPVAGAGAPLISDFAVMELGAHLERGLDSARNYVGQVVELAYRLPRIWAEVLAGRVPVWKALRTADFTRPLSAEGAAFVDRQLARFAATCTWTQIERLVDEAVARFDPDLAEARREAARDQRRFDVALDRASIEGTTAVDGILDTVDALDLEQAVADIAAQLGRLGDTDPLNARRAKALGDLARGEWALDLDSGDETGPAPVRRPAKRTIALHLHLSTAALEGASNVGRLADTRSPVLVEQIRAWLGAPEASILLRPVIDLAGCERVDAYEIPDRLRRQVLEREATCAFPHCTRPAEGCDLDHCEPYDSGGQTCPCNLAPVCRGHHRLKTSGRWTYLVLDPGQYLWTNSTGDRWLVTPRGTRIIRHATAATPPDG